MVGTPLILCAALALAGCGLFERAAAPSSDPCTAEIVRLEGLRSQEVLGACAGQTFDECAPVIEAIDEKYAPFILAQIRCVAPE